MTNVIGLKPQQARPTLADLDEMPYLDAVFKETNRLSPAMPGFARDLNDDLDIGGETYFFCCFTGRGFEFLSSSLHIPG